MCRWSTGHSEISIIVTQALWFIFERGFAVTLYAAIAAYRVRWQPKRSDSKSWVSWSCAKRGMIHTCHFSLAATLPYMQQLRYTRLQQILSLYWHTCIQGQPHSFCVCKFVNLYLYDLHNLNLFFLSVNYVGPDGWKKHSGDDVGELHYHYYPVMPSTVEQEMVEVGGA